MACSQHSPCSAVLTGAGATCWHHDRALHRGSVLHVRLSDASSNERRLVLYLCAHYEDAFLYLNHEKKKTLNRRARSRPSPSGRLTESRPRSDRRPSAPHSRPLSMPWSPIPRRPPTRRNRRNRRKGSPAQFILTHEEPLDKILDLVPGLAESYLS